MGWSPSGILRCSCSGCGTAGALRLRSRPARTLSQELLEEHHKIIIIIIIIRFSALALLR